VKKDQVLVVCGDPELDGKIERLNALIRGAKLEEQQALGEGDPGKRQVAQIHLETFGKQLKDLTRQKEEQTIRAPFDGQVIAPDLKFLAGSWLERGKEVCTVATTDKLVCRAVLTQRDIALASKHWDRADGTLKLDRPARIRLVGDVKTPLDGGTTRLIPAAQAVLPGASLTTGGGGEIENDRTFSAADRSDEKMQTEMGKRPQISQFELRVDVANPQDLYTSGQRAYVRLLVDERPLVWQWYDRFLQLIETKSANSKWI
jgi:hypothetical protein